MADVNIEGPPDFYNLIAKERGVPDGWRWFAIRAVGENRRTGAALVTGAVCSAVYTKGKYKGHTNWTKRDKSTERELLITFADYDARELQWERETGKCHKCGGSGKEATSFSSTGNTYRDCARCNATGNAAQPDVSPSAVRSALRRPVVGGGEDA